MQDSSPLFLGSIQAAARILLHTASKSGGFKIRNYHLIGTLKQKLLILKLLHATKTASPFNKCGLREVKFSVQKYVSDFYEMFLV